MKCPLRRRVSRLAAAAILCLAPSFAPALQAQTMAAPPPAAAACGSTTCFVFEPIAPRSGAAVKDFATRPELNAALRAYQTAPSMTTAIGVLQFFTSDFYKMSPAQRNALFERDPALFLSVDIAKYEIVMQVRKQLAPFGVRRSIRVGSSGRRELAIIQWVKDGRKGEPPILDGTKQFVSDDDITNRTMEITSLADERVNEAAARTAFLDVTERVFGNRLDPKVVQVEFLSPTAASEIFGRKYGKGAPPEFLNAFVQAHPEKYNDPLGVYMVEKWGYDGGVVTLDVTNPVHTTTTIKDATDRFRHPLFDAPGEPPAHGLAGYMADNYRQIYSVHDARFESQCKYLVRMIDGWAAVNGKGQLTSEWLKIRTLADHIYRHGDDVPGAAEFKGQIAGHIRNVVLAGHAHQLTRVEEALRALPAQLKESAARTLTPDAFKAMLDANKSLATELDGLLSAYTNVPPDVHDAMMLQFVLRFDADNIADSPQQALIDRLLMHVMEVVQHETDVQRGAADAFVKIREHVIENLGRAIGDTDLHAFLTRIARGEVRQSVLRRDGWRITREERVLTPQEVLSHVEMLHAVAQAAGWPTAREAERLAQYLKAGPDGNSIQLLTRLYRIFDASKAAPIEVPEVARAKDDQTSTRVTIRPNPENMGLRLFAAALITADAARTAGQAVTTSAEWWGNIQDGRDLFKNLETLFKERPGMTDAEIGQTQAALFANAVGLSHVFSAEFWKKAPLTSRGLTSNTAAVVATSAGGAFYDDAATDQLLGAVLKDLTILYAPQLAPAIILYDLSSWAYAEYALASDRNAVVQAMVENGAWAPSDAAGLRALAPGTLPTLKGIRARAGGDVLGPKALATIALGTVTLSKSRTEVETRKALIDLLWDGGLIDNDTVLAASRDAVREASGNYFARKLNLATLSNDGRAGPIGDGWTSEALGKAGILVDHREDDRSRRVSPADVRAQKDGATPAELNHLRTLGLLVGDFWVKQQIVLEERLLPELEKVAARLFLNEVRAEEAVESKNYLSQVDEVYSQVKAIDERLWLRVAQSAGPAAPREFDSRDDDQLLVLRAFRKADRVVSAVAQLQQLEAFLKDPGRTTIDLRLNGETVPGVDRKSAELQAEAELTSIRTYYYEVLDAYEQLHDFLDRGEAATRAGRFEVKPFHLKLAPDAATLTAGDTALAKTWLLTYQGARKQVLDAIVERTRTSPPEGFLGRLGQAADKIAKAMARDPIDTSGSPEHPVWPALVKLRYEINKLETMKGFVTTMTATELEGAVTSMTDGKGESVWNDKWSAGSPSDRATVIAAATATLERDYQDLLARLTDLFTFKTPTVDNATPFIGQAFTVSAAPSTDGTAAVGKVGANGFPDFVAGFHWMIRDAAGNAMVSESDSDGPSASLVMKRSGTYTIEVVALDRGRNVVARSAETVRITARPLTLRGSVGVQSGDYAGETIGLLPSVGGVRGGMALSGPGPFELEVFEFDERPWRSARMSARVSADGRSVESNASEFDVAPASGLVTVRDPLLLPFPFNVSATVAAVDAAGIDVPSAAVRVGAGGREVQGREVALRLWPGAGVSATIVESRLDTPIEQTVRATFDPAGGRAIRLRAVLPMFDVNHVTISGRFVPDAALTPAPALSGGQIISPVGNAAVSAGGGFSFRNARPVDLRGGAQVQAHAVVTDASRRLYRPKIDPLTVTLRGAVIDLGSIEVVARGLTVKPILARLSDITGAPLPAGTGELLIDGKPAARQGDAFVGEHTFTQTGESIIVQGGYRLENGQLSVVQQTLSAAAFMLPDAPPPSYQMKLPFYLPGSLHLTGTTRVDKLPNDPAPPSQLTLQDAPHGVSVTGVADAAFDITLPVAVQATESLGFAAVGKGSGTITYRGVATTRAPWGASVVDVGEVVLTGSGTPADAPAFLQQTQATSDPPPSGGVPGFLGPDPGDTRNTTAGATTARPPATDPGDALDRIRQQVLGTNRSEEDRIHQDASKRKAEAERLEGIRRKAEEERVAAIRRQQEADRLEAIRQKEEEDRLARERRQRRADGAQAFMTGFLNGLANAVDAANQPAAADPAASRQEPITEQPLRDIVVSSHRVTITLWDTQCEDGDRVSVRINGRTVVDNVTLTNARRSFDVSLPEPINSMDLISESTGTDCPPGTVPPDRTVNSGAMTVSNALEGGSQNWQLANGTRGSTAQIRVK
jgi:hypothetical protein